MTGFYEGMLAQGMIREGQLSEEIVKLKEQLQARVDEGAPSPASRAELEAESSFNTIHAAEEVCLYKNSDYTCKKSRNYIN